jgi:hypothetical protein
VVSRGEGVLALFLKVLLCGREVLQALLGVGAGQVVGGDEMTEREVHLIEGRRGV